MTNINHLMKQAQAMQQKLQAAQAEIANKSYTGDAGGGMVTVSMSGKGEVQSLKIDPSLLNKEELEMLEDLIITALKNAKKKLDEDAQDSMSGLLPPGFKMPF